MKRIIYLFLCLTLPAAVQSCLIEEKDIFEESAVERVEAYLNSYKTLLSSNEDYWLLEYYAEEEQSYGGYVYILKFEDEQVTAYFQLAEDCSRTVTSYYNLVGDDGPVLTFDTYNEYLHYFATPNITDYEALHGDYEFNVMGKSDDGSEIYLRGKKTGNSMVLRKFDKDPVEYLNAVNSVSAAMSAPGYEMTVGGTAHSCSISGNILQYAIAPSEEGAAAEEGRMAFCYTDTGIVFYEPIEIAGVEYDSFAFDTDHLVSPDGKILISKVIPPLNQLFVQSDWYIAYSTLGSYAKPYFDMVQSVEATLGEELIWAFFGSSLYGVWGFNFNSSGYGGCLGYDYQLEGEDTITMMFNMTGQGNGVWYHNEGFAYALMPFGYSSAKTFVLTSDNDDNPTEITLTDTSNPANVITLHSQMVAYPFEN